MVCFWRPIPGPCVHDITLTNPESVSADLWRRKPDGRPLKVGVVLGDLSHARNVAPSLFEEDRNHDALADAMDRINQAFGKDVVFFGGMIGTRDQNLTRIAFTRIPELEE